MTPWERVEDLFHRAAECPVEERAARLAEWCVGDAALQAEVESLLEAAEAAGGAGAGAGADPWLGRTVGAWRIESLIGRGGMGAVYLGRRIAGDFQQEIAFKLVATRLAAPWLRERFLIERQALASLSHPNIARLLDGGVTGEGEPYFVMEYIEGRRLDEYCEETGGSVAAIVGLMLQLCDAVSFVHRNLIVHRDLKPGNVLVTADGRVKLLDFGAAKLLDPSGGRARTEATRMGVSALTPQYASPEQILGGTVTAASDVYSLGVILYRLLTGRLPYDQAGLFTGTAVPAGAGIPDLDAVVLKALQPKVEDRYASAGALAADLRNFLDHRPVSARGGSFAYRARKLLRRRAAAIGAAAAITIAMAAGLLATMREARIAAAQEARAREGFRGVHRLARLLLFDFYDQVKQLPASTDVQRLLVSQSLGYLDGLSRSSTGDPDVQLDLVEAYTKMGNVLGNPYEENLGDAPKALESLQKGLALAEDAVRRRPDDALAIRRLDLARRSLAEVHFSTGDTAQAVRYSRQAAESFDQLAQRPGAALADVQEAAGTFDSLGDLYGLHASAAVGDRNEALKCYRHVLVLDEKALAMAPGNVRAIRGMAVAYMKIANVEGDTRPMLALEGYRKSLAKLSQLPAEAQRSMLTVRVGNVVRRKLGGVYADIGRPREGIPYLEAVRAFGTSLLARDPEDSRTRFDLATVNFDLGQMYFEAGKPGPARDAFARVVRQFDVLLARDPHNLVWQGHRAEALYQLGSLDHDERASRQALDAVLKVAADPRASPDDFERAAEDLLEIEPARWRNPKAALDFASRAAAQSRNGTPRYLVTLAKAQKACGDAAAARDTARKVLALIPPPAPGEPAPQLRKAAEKLAAR